MSGSSSETSSSSEDTSSEVEEAFVVYGKYEPYAHEPLASKSSAVDSSNNESVETNENDVDIDGLTPSILAKRYEQEISVQDWCKCENCSGEKLVGCLEYRCCREVVDTTGKMVFDGSIEHIKCITQHEDFLAITNQAVLTLTGQALKRIDGSFYRKKKNVSVDE